MVAVLILPVKVLLILAFTQPSLGSFILPQQRFLFLLTAISPKSTCMLSFVKLVVYEKWCDFFFLN